MQHARVAEREDATDIEKRIDNSGCAKQYYALEECLAENDRKFGKCQKEVLDLKTCNSSKKPGAPSKASESK